MSDCKLPNAVGRIDAIVEVIEQGDRSLAMGLLRVYVKKNIYKKTTATPLTMPISMV